MKVLAESASVSQIWVNKGKIGFKVANYKLINQSQQGHLNKGLQISGKKYLQVSGFG